MDESKRLKAIKDFTYYDFDNSYYWEEWREKNEILQRVNKKMEEWENERTKDKQ